MDVLNMFDILLASYSIILMYKINLDKDLFYFNWVVDILLMSLSDGVT